MDYGHCNPLTLKGRILSNNHMVGGIIGFIDDETLEAIRRKRKKESGSRLRLEKSQRVHNTRNFQFQDVKI